MQRAKAGEELEPTDKGYKVYLDHRKFYFSHLSDEQKAEFITLIDSRTLKMAYPGYFYVIPYFAR